MSPLQYSHTWLVTGASQGLGLAIAMSALKAGHNVIAAARNPRKAAEEHPELEMSGGRWLELDVNSVDVLKTIESVVNQAGHIDVVVNNAGYFLPGTIEDLEESEMYAIMETNFFGPIRVIKGVLPVMRAQSSGTIVLMGSIFGFYACPGGAMYSCSKAAAELLHETLRKELAPFNIRTLIIEPGLFRTAVVTNAPQPVRGFSEPYLSTAIGKTLGLVENMVRDPAQYMPGDPSKLGDRVVDFIDESGMAKHMRPTARLLLGRDAVKLYKLKLQSLTEDLEASDQMATSTDYDGHTGQGVSVVANF
ncbi:hypothetical protein OHC33_011280 [Knufia fluminis]|uniref:NAD(P)-binding protein n=1 Tax=Knufia fluminis TaxID=191047 RepID=A0AAN8I207_9EURO|nr:hypothetical protein OHC33_011280 [Knufia fluminis]